MKNLFDDGKTDALTDAAVRNPKVGDRFSEMMNWWLYVVGVDDTKVVTMESVAPCTFPGDGETHVWTRVEFIEYLSYNGIPGYWARYIDGANDVEGWIPDWAAAELKTPTPRPDPAPYRTLEWWW